MPPSQLAHLKLDVARQSAAGALRRPTAFLMLAWPLGADIAGQLAEELVALPSDKARTVTLNAIWKSHEAAAGSASFESAKFSVQCDAALERRLRIAEFGTDPLDPPSTTVDGAAGAAAARAAAASAAAGASSAKPAGSAVGGGGRGGDQLPGEAANASHAVRPGGPAGDADAGVGAAAAAAAEEEEEDSSDPAVMAARLLEATEALLALEHERDELVRLLQRRERDNEVRARTHACCCHGGLCGRRHARTHVARRTTGWGRPPSSAGGWGPNACRRPPAPPGRPSHQPATHLPRVPRFPLPARRRSSYGRTGRPRQHKQPWQRPRRTRVVWVGRTRRWRQTG